MNKTKDTPETFPERLNRVEQMCMDVDGEKWDLSGNDTLALLDLLGSYSAAIASLREFVALYDGVTDMLGQSVTQKLARARVVIAKAEGAK